MSSGDATPVKLLMISLHFAIQQISQCISKWKFTFVKWKSDIQLLELILMNKVSHSMNSTNLLLRNECAVNRPLESDSLLLEISQCAKILHSDTFHVLRATSENSPFIVDVSWKWLMRPKLLKHWHNVHMRVQNYRLEVWLCSQPCQNHNWLLRSHRNYYLKLKLETIGLTFQELDGRLWKINLGDSRLVNLNVKVQCLHAISSHVDIFRK